MTAIALVLLIGGGSQTAAPAARPSPCSQALAGGTSRATAELCLGEEQARLAAAAPKDTSERSRFFESAARHYRIAADLASTTDIKVSALEALSDVYGPTRLNEPAHWEAVLNELVALQPLEVTPKFRLARMLEDRGYLDAAEDTLLMACRQHPGALDVYRMLAQFYARRATALHKASESEKPQATSAAGQADENGVYRIGGAVTPPQRLGQPVYPAEAQAAGIKGAVLAEVVINPAGDVTDAKILRSIPLLDDAALQAVRHWHFAPTLVNGQAVPVRMTVTVNFSLK